MNTLQLAKKFNHGGVATHVTDLSEGLIILGHKAIIASSNGTHVGALENIDHYVIDFSLSNPFKFIESIYKLIALIKNKKIDVVHCHNRSCALYMMLISKFISIPYLWSLHQENIPSNFLFRWFTFYGRKAIGPTISLHEFLVKILKIPNEKTAIVHYGIDIKKYKKISEEAISQLKVKFKIKNEKVITLLGRLEEIKGHKCLLEAIAKLENKKEVKVIFVGDADAEYKSKLDSLINKHEIENQIIYSGYISAKEVLSITDLMVLPSYKDGITLAVLDSFAMGVPVVRTKTSGYRDVKDFCIGMAFDDSDFLAHEIKNLIEGKDYSLMTEKANDFVQKEWSRENMRTEILKIYNEILGFPIRK